MAGYAYIKKGPIKTKDPVNSEGDWDLTIFFSKQLRENLLKMKQLN